MDGGAALGTLKWLNLEGNEINTEVQAALQESLRVNNKQLACCI